MNITFKKADKTLLPTIFKWLEEPHMKEFWDNTPEHKNDIVSFVEGHKQTYFAGTTHYWVGFVEEQPFCFILSDQIEKTQNLSDAYRKNLSPHGHTIALDMGIGNPLFLGKSLASVTLQAFIDFYRSKVDKAADTFFIDPDENNPRAQHVYKKAGFRQVGEHFATEGAFIGQKSLLLVKKF